MSVTVQRFKDLAQRFVDDTFAEFAETFTIEQATNTPDGQGGFTTSWATFATISGFVTSDNGQESIEDSRLKSSYRKNFQFEYLAGIDNAMRINFDSKIYNIRSIVTEQESTIWIRIIADEEVAT